MKKKKEILNKKKYLDLIKNLNIFKNSNFKSWDEFLDKIQLKTCKAKTTIIKQNDTRDEVFFILRGSVDILINDKRHKTRKAGEHIGEIVSLFPHMKRTATVMTAESTEFAIMKGQDFRNFIKDHKYLYKPICETLANRLSDRNCYIKESNKKPIIFIGSSKEGKRKMQSIVNILKKDKFIVKPWTKDVFELSKTTIENLEKTLQECDFAILLITGDDKIIKRGAKKTAPRDNIIFEIGLAMGYLGRERTICLLYDKECNFPSDLSGVTHLDYNKKKDVISHITNLGCR